MISQLLADSRATALWANFKTAVDAARERPSWITMFAVLLRLPLLFVSLPLPALLVSLYITIALAYLLYFFYVLIRLLLEGGFHFLRSIQLWSCDYIESHISTEGLSVQTGPLHLEQERYEYQPLDCQGDFRLLQVRRRFFGGIAVRIIHANLTSTPKYQCVSYTWGGLPADQVLVIDGAALPISTIVRDGVKRLASLWVKQFIWIDAVCIDQSNIEEKGIQVQLMKEIFHQAESVLVWLGNPQSYLGVLESPGGLSSQRQPDLVDFCANALDLNDTMRGDALKFDPKYHQLCDEIFQHIVTHSFWSRCWVIQEIALARDVRIVYGKWTVHWNRFITFVEFHYDSARHGHERFEPSQLRGMNQILIFEHLRKRYHQDGRSSLSDILRQCANFQATDQRDRIYALRGIVVPKHSNFLVPNYLPDNKVWMLYRDAQEMLLTDPEYGFDLLNLAGTGWTRKVENLPSWVPDWSCLPETYTGTSIQNYDEDFKDELWDWSERSIPRIHCHPEDKRLVTVYGFHIDRIIALSGVDHQSGNNILESWVSWLKETYTMARELGGNVYPNGQLLHEAYVEFLEVSERVGSTYPVMSKADRDPAQCPYPNEEWQSLRKSWLRILGGKLKTDALKTTALTSVLQEALQEVPHNHLEQFKRDEADMTVMRLGMTHPLFASTAIRPFKSGAAEPGRFAVTEKGYIALVPPLTAVGDDICVVMGGSTTYVMRIVGNGKSARNGDRSQRYELVGGCFTHGMMYGEASEMGMEETGFILE